MNKQFSSWQFTLFFRRYAENKYLVPLFIFFIIFFSWLPSAFINFINDDFQLIGWQNPNSLLDCFIPFYKKVDPGVYWRPMVYFLDSITKYLFGFKPLLYHLENITIHSINCILIYRFSSQLKLSGMQAFILTVFFGLLPIRITAATWLGGRSDSLMAMFLLFSVINYYKAYKFNMGKNYLLAIFFYIFAVLSKEIAYSGIFVPFLFLILDKRENRKIFLTVKATGLALLIIVISLIYRYFTIGGMPFESTNFNDISLMKTFSNIFLSFPLSFVSPDFLEILWFLVINNFGFMFLLLIIFIGIAILIYKYKFSIIKKEIKILLFGLLWFLVFTLPAAPTLMRWYVYSSSIGLMLIIGAIFENKIKIKNIETGQKVYFLPFLRMQESKNPHEKEIPEFAGMTKILIFKLFNHTFNTLLRMEKNVRYYIFEFALIIIIFSSIFVNIYHFSIWNDAAYKTNLILSSLRNISISGYKTIILWGLPDKFDRVNALKIGSQEAVQWFMNNKNIDFLSPLRTECSLYSTIEINKINEAEFELILTDGRFLPAFSRSRAVIIREELFIDDQDFEVKINNNLEESRIISSAHIILKKKNHENLNLFFNGNGFEE